MDRARAKRLATDIEAALQPLAAQHGLQIVVKSPRFDATTYTAKIECSERSDGQPSANCLGCGQRFEPIPNVAKIATWCDGCHWDFSDEPEHVEAAKESDSCPNCGRVLCTEEQPPNTPKPQCGFWGCEKLGGHDGMHRATAQVIEPPEYDFRLEGEGPITTVFRLVPLTDGAKGWIADNVSRTEGFQPDYPTLLFVEHRYIDPLMDGIAFAGLTVDVVERAPASRGPLQARCQHCNEPIKHTGTCPTCGLQATRQA